MALAEANPGHVFRYSAPAGTRSVCLAGSFNNWSKEANPMRLQADGTTWSIDLPLAPGKFQYKFVVNGETWITDPGAPSLDDGNGNTNSVVIIFPPGYDVPARKGDGTITYGVVNHLQTLPALNWDRGWLTLTLQARPNDVERVSVDIQVGTGKRQKVVMADRGGDEFTTNYVASIPWNRTEPVRYDFELDDGGRGPGIYDRSGFWYQKESDGTSADERFVLDPKTYHPFVPPTWVQKSFIYQIFPDRFADGDKSNDPPGTVPWDSKPTWYTWFGGDFAGVREHLDYLKSLGADCVYFNPIFEGPSNHRYEATDYKRVDHRLGTNAEFASLTKRMSDEGIRVVLDGVFNHTATDFFAFADLLKNQQKSRYLDWYHVTSFPVEVKMPPPYVAWFGFASMPKLNHENPAVRDYLLSVPDFWGKTATIAGWRLDVPNELPFDFWPLFRRHIKAFGQDKWIVGEIWGDGSPWLKGDMFDSVMNYQFRNAVLAFVAHGTASPSQYWSDLMRVEDAYGTQVSRNMMNLISSHDVPRILTECSGDARLARMAAMLQFTWVGAPSVYYGDELGMEGAKDPDNRRGMRWDLVTANNPFLLTYKALSQLRAGVPALTEGDPALIATDDKRGLLVFRREFANQWAVVGVNRSLEKQEIHVALKGAAKVWRAWNGAQSVQFKNEAQPSAGGQVTVTVEPLSIVVLTPKEQAAAQSSMLSESRHSSLVTSHLSHPIGAHP